MFDMMYTLYMMESAGMDKVVNTKEARIKAAINEFISLARKGYNINDLQEQVFRKHNLSLNSLSAKEKNRIKRAVERNFH